MKKNFILLHHCKVINNSQDSSAYKNFQKSVCTIQLPNMKIIPQKSVNFKLR